MSQRIVNFLLFLLVAVTAVATERVFTVVIDPGHGGKDYGCIGKLTNEKTVVLDVATRLGKMINKEHPEVKTVFTRADDRFIPLNDRASIANKANADLFISVHVNSIDKRTKGREKIHGASVYSLGLHRSDDNLAVAMRENSVIELEPDFSEEYQGFDPNSSESYIIFELTQNQHMQHSLEFSENIQRELVTTAGRADKGVRQSGFLVLRATSMPAVLVELDFICNAAAEKFLASSDGREKCARSIANAFSTYYIKHRPQPAEKTKKTAAIERARLPYAVCLFSAKERVADSDPRIKKAKDVNVIEHDGVYNYVTGSYKTLKQAKKALKAVKRDFPEASIIKLGPNE